MQCPTCNRTIADEIQCPRCGRDLAGIVKIRTIAEGYLHRGRKSLAGKEFHAALQDFKTAYNLYHSPEAKKDIAIALFSLGRFREALKAALQYDDVSGK